MRCWLDTVTLSLDKILNIHHSLHNGCWKISSTWGLVASLILKGCVMQISHVVLVISGGWNNNCPVPVNLPSTAGSMWTSSRNHHSSSFFLDGTIFVCGLPTSSYSEENPEVASPLSDEQYVFQQADYHYTSPLVKALVDNVVVYIAGWVVTNLLFDSFISLLEVASVSLLVIELCMYVFCNGVVG